MDSPSSKRQEAALKILDELYKRTGSYQKAVKEIVDRTGLPITPEAIRKALGARRVGDTLIEIAEALAKNVGPTTPPASVRAAPERVVEYEDQYSERPPAIAYLRNIVEPEIIEMLQSMSSKAAQTMDTDAWIQEGLRRQKQRRADRLSVDEAPVQPAPPPIDVSTAALEARAKKFKR